MKIEVKAMPLIHPTTIVFVGTMIHDKPNLTTIGDVAVAGINPALIMISINEKHNCMTYINTHQRFTINVPTKDMVKEVDYAGIYSSFQTDKSSLIDMEIIDGLPVVADAPITLFVSVLERVQIKQRVILVCEVTKTLLLPSLISDKKLDFSSLKTVSYGLDNKYYTTGETIGEGYKTGLRME